METNGLSLIITVFSLVMWMDGQKSCHVNPIKPLSGSYHHTLSVESHLVTGAQHLALHVQLLRQMLL